MVEDVLVLPYAKQGLIGEVYESARVLSEEYDETGRVLKVRGLPGAIDAAAAQPGRALSIGLPHGISGRGSRARRGAHSVLDRRHPGRFRAGCGLRPAFRGGGRGAGPVPGL